MQYKTYHRQFANRKKVVWRHRAPGSHTSLYLQINGLSGHTRNTCVDTGYCADDCCILSINRSHLSSSSSSINIRRVIWLRLSKLATASLRVKWVRITICHKMNYFLRKKLDSPLQLGLMHLTTALSVIFTDFFCLRRSSANSIQWYPRFRLTALSSSSTGFNHLHIFLFICKFCVNPSRVRDLWMGFDTVITNKRPWPIRSERQP